MKAVTWLSLRPLLGFFAAAYGVSWGGILVVVGITGFDMVQLRPMDTGFIFVLMLLGPSIAGLACTALLDGHRGLREMRWRLMRWRIGGRWYAIALLTAPIPLLTVLCALSVVDSAFAPRFQWPLFAIGLIAGSCEELGWTGFATPRLLARYRLFSAGALLGVAWALWHLLVDFRQNGNAMGMAWPLEFAALYLAALIAYRVLMTWVFAHTQSLALAILMHASYTGWLLALFPATSVAQGLVWQTAFAALLWVAAALAIATGRSGPDSGSTA